MLFRSGRVRVIGVSAAQRQPGAIAAVSTWKEQGYDAVFSNWRGVVGARGLSPAQVAYWEDVFSKLVDTDEWKRDLEKNLWSPQHMNSAESRRFLEQEAVKLRGILGELGLAK